MSGATFVKEISGLPQTVSHAWTVRAPALFKAVQLYMPSYSGVFLTSGTTKLPLASCMLPVGNPFDPTIVHFNFGFGTPEAWQLRIAEFLSRTVVLFGAITNSGKTKRLTSGISLYKI